MGKALAQCMQAEREQHTRLRAFLLVVLLLLLLMSSVVELILVLQAQQVCPACKTLGWQDLVIGVRMVFRGCMVFLGLHGIWGFA